MHAYIPAALRGSLFVTVICLRSPISRSPDNVEIHQKGLRVTLVRELLTKHLPAGHIKKKSFLILSVKATKMKMCEKITPSCCTEL